MAISSKMRLRSNPKFLSGFKRFASFTGWAGRSGGGTRRRQCVEVDHKHEP